MSSDIHKAWDHIDGGQSDYLSSHLITLHHFNIYLFVSMQQLRSFDITEYLYLFDVSDDDNQSKAHSKTDVGCHVLM